MPILPDEIMKSAVDFWTSHFLITLNHSSVASLKRTAKAREIVTIPKGKDRVPTINIQGISYLSLGECHFCHKKSPQFHVCTKITHLKLNMVHLKTPN